MVTAYPSPAALHSGPPPLLRNTDNPGRVGDVQPCQLALLRYADRRRCGERGHVEFAVTGAARLQRAKHCRVVGFGSTTCEVSARSFRKPRAVRGLPDHAQFNRHGGGRTRIDADLGIERRRVQGEPPRHEAACEGTARQSRTRRPGSRARARRAEWSPEVGRRALRGCSDAGGCNRPRHNEAGAASAGSGRRGDSARDTMRGWVPDVVAERLAPRVGDRSELRTEHKAQRGHPAGERVVEVPVLAPAEAVPGHERPAAEHAVLLVERYPGPAFPGGEHRWHQRVAVRIKVGGDRTPVQRRDLRRKAEFRLRRNVRPACSRAQDEASRASRTRLRSTPQR